jgi:uncharacterized membrane protein YkvA (DUF1232 family)
VSQQLDAIKQWVSSLREDIETVKAVVDSEKVDPDARKFAASALSYLVTRMDLVPDWNETIGVLDDVMVIRVCMGLASAYGLEEGLESDTLIGASRLANDAERVNAFLGEDLAARFRRYCARLSEEAVRGRTPEGIVEDAAARARLYEEIDADLLRMPAAPFDDPDALIVTFKSYLHHKLA